MKTKNYRETLCFVDCQNSSYNCSFIDEVSSVPCLDTMQIHISSIIKTILDVSSFVRPKLS